MAIKTYKVAKVTLAAAEISEVVNATLNITLENTDRTSFGDSWKEVGAQGKSWELSISFTYDPANAQQLSLQTEFISGDGDIADIRMYEDATKYYSGAAIITSFGITTAVGGDATVAATFVGNGPLSYT